MYSLKKIITCLKILILIKSFQDAVEIIILSLNCIMGHSNFKNNIVKKIIRDYRCRNICYVVRL